MLEALKRLLRGNSNSIRYKYWTLPKEWLVYTLAYRISGRSWIDFYADRLDRQAQKAAEIKPAYLESGREHLDYLVKHGLEPHHQFLDYGCGVMRTGACLGSYLTEGRYVGIDISGQRIQKGRNLLANAGIHEDRYQAITIHDYKLKELDGMTFDFVWANSVFTHLPLDDIVSGRKDVVACATLPESAESSSGSK